MTKAIVTGLFVITLGIVTSTADVTPYFQVLIREIDNPSGNLLDGTPCTPFGFTGFGCNTLLTGGVAVGSDITTTLLGTALNTHGETKISNLNLIMKDVNANAATEFTFHSDIKPILGKI
ncbi:hypothetical protein GCK72_015224 [Caenorhabditis remanei]|uniref:Uncharacterized protein n=1 Tax=Caenorhabditis remanei TaxID=31234 RepID=A0A6A5GVT0_CAERE|nr:hypothetical protein GCK72_015224 [Caenorhabditis remanei]KAF1758764.1 hypothetical protein GCK72_015224 [Caenorhabditis remanei]